MTRFAWIALAITGCYSPGNARCAISCATGDDCPGDLVCSTSNVCGASLSDCTGTPSDGTTDGDATGMTDDDAAGSTCLGAGGAAKVFDTTTGFFYTTNGTIAIYQSGAELRVSPFDVNLKGNLITIADSDPNRSHTRPRLDPASEDLYLLATNMVGACELVRATRVSGTDTWSSLVTLTTNIANLCTVVPGSPTTTNPRHMLISTGPTSILEGTEVGADNWIFTTLPVPPGFDEYEQPALSSDGLHMLFRGRKTATGVIALYGASRNQLTQPFGTPTELADNPDGGSGVETTPTFSPDCQVIYVSLDSPDRVVRLQ